MIIKNPQESIQKRTTQIDCKTWVHKKATLFLFHFAVYIDSKYQLQTQVSRILFFLFNYNQIYLKQTIYQHLLSS